MYRLVIHKMQKKNVITIKNENKIINFVCMYPFWTFYNVENESELSILNKKNRKCIKTFCCSPVKLLTKYMSNYS